jgi:hypothetical protein
MKLSEAPQPSEPVGTGPSRRVILAVGGGTGLTAFLSACGVSGLPHLQVSTTGLPASRVTQARPYIRITTTGARFSPTVGLAAGSTATVSWLVEGGETVTGTNPTIDFGTAARRHVRLSVHDGEGSQLDQVITFNLGFNHLEDAGLHNMGAGHDKAPQTVSLVENISRLKGLIRFAAAHTALAGPLDFTGCSRLKYIECRDSNVQSVNVTGCTSLIRLVVEQTDLTSLDLNPVAANLRDLRGAAQKGGTLTLTPLTAPLAALYHFCVVDQIVVNHPTSAQLPIVEERWDWDTHQSGVLTSASSAIRSVETSGNRFTTADFTNQFPAGRNATLNASSNNLRAVNLTGCDGLSTIRLNNNNLTTAAVDSILATVESWGTSGGTLDLTANSHPSAQAVTSATTLAKRGWVLTFK